MTIAETDPTVNELSAARISLIPIRNDGSKAPAVAWTVYQSELPTPEQLSKWFDDETKQYGIAAVCGAISGGLVLIDFDDADTLRLILDTAESLGYDAPAQARARWSEQSPRDGGSGEHWFVFVPGVDITSGPVAARPNPDNPKKPDPLIDLKARGGYCIMAPSGGKVHPSGGQYIRLSGGPTTALTLTPEQWEQFRAFLEIADEQPPKQAFATPTGKASASGTRPGDDLNAKADEGWWRQRTEADGWTWTPGAGGVFHLARPGNPPGWTGATWNWGGRGHLRVFTTSAGLEPGMYDAFGYVAHWDHGGDLKAAARALAAEGYGKRAAPFTMAGDADGPDDAGEPGDGMQLTASLAYGKGRYWSVRQSAGDVEWSRLCNFDAVINEHRIITDGQTTRQEYTISGAVAGVAFEPFTIPQSDFAGLGWVGQMGPEAIITAGSSIPGKLRQAIQERSVRLGIEREEIHAHSGWIERGGEHIYLSTSGGIGPDGLRPGVAVELPGKLAHLNLPAPPTEAQLKAEAPLWLMLWELAPERIMAPLLAAVARAILAPFLPIESSIQLEGRTGTRKSELTARMQQFFGPAFDRLTLPGSWFSTANSIMLLLHTAKDAIAVIDDHVVDGSRTEQDKQRAVQNRVFSSVGNHADRGRLDGNMQQRPEYVPRGLVLSSGEDQSYRQSSTARTLLIEVRAGDVRLDVLTKAQAAGEEGAFARLTAGFVQAVARNWDATGRAYRERYRQYQERYRANLTAHARTPDSAAALIAALDVWCDFLQHAGAIDQDTKADLLKRAGRGFLELGMAQAAALAAVDPLNQFVELTRSALGSGAAHLALVSDGGVPTADNPIACGYRIKIIHTRDHDEPDYQPQGVCIGWIDERGIFLNPDAALATAQTIGAKTGQSIPWQPKTLCKRLAERGWIVSNENGRNTIRTDIAGARRAVLHVKRELILPPAAGDPDNVRAFAGANGTEAA